jgi:hypothetical protein
MNDGIVPIQSESQSQTTSVVINVEKMSDPALERRIFSEVASAGRQLGRMSDVLELLITAFVQNASAQMGTDAIKTIDAFRAMRKQIQKEKSERSPERIIEALENMRLEDTATYRVVASRLRQWLSEQPEINGSSVP